MECPVCKTALSAFQEILMIVDRSFHCHHCWTRLVSYPDTRGVYGVEVDLTGEKREKMDNPIHVARFKKPRNFEMGK